MLVDVKALGLYTAGTADREIGGISDLLFDDQKWVVRYIVVDTGGWFRSNEILISPRSATKLDDEQRRIVLDLTEEQIRAAPDVAADKPISREGELLLARYYGWAAYWETEPLPLHVGQSVAAEAGRAGRREIEPLVHSSLRSAKEVMGYKVHATDGGIGHVENYIMDAEHWAIRYLIVDTRNWWPGRHVLISPFWAQKVSWAEGTLTLDVDRETVKNSPEYDEAAGIDRDFEEKLHEHYGRAKYWQ